MTSSEIKQAQQLLAIEVKSFESWCRTGGVTRHDLSEIDGDIEYAQEELIEELRGHGLFIMLDADDVYRDSDSEFQLECWNSPWFLALAKRQAACNFFA